MAGGKEGEVKYIPDWPRLMRKATLARYLDITPSEVEKEVRAAADKSVDVKLEYAFDPALDVNGPGPQAIIDTLTKFGTAAAFVTARAEN